MLSSAVSKLLQKGKPEEATKPEPVPLRLGELGGQKIVYLTLEDLLSHAYDNSFTARDGSAVEQVVCDTTPLRIPVEGGTLTVNPARWGRFQIK